MAPRARALFAGSHTQWTRTAPRIGTSCRHANQASARRTVTRSTRPNTHRPKGGIHRAAGALARREPTRRPYRFVLAIALHALAIIARSAISTGVFDGRDVSCRSRSYGVLRSA